MKDKQQIKAPINISQENSPMIFQHFVSFDGGVVADGLLQRPDRYRFWRSSNISGCLIPRGAGLSYAGASFLQDGLSVENGLFNRILDFDSKQHVVEVEAGIELSALYDFLSSHGLYLPIQPGHGRITVGGCIAADVHGKNQAKDGTFINQVVGLTLFHPNQGMFDVSPEIDPDLFRLTCGGYGLTGNIVRAKLRASLIPSSTLILNAIPVGNTFLGVDQLEHEALDADLAYTWHDFSLRGNHFGRGYVYLARFVSENENLNSKDVFSALPTLSSNGRMAWKLSLLNPYTTRVLNFAYRSKQKLQGQIRLMNLHNTLFPIHETQFYYKLFGSRGFHEYQVVMPTEHIHDYLEAVRDYLISHPVAVTLASAKLFRGQQELLRFTGNGTCFALNFPRTNASSSFLDFLDELVVSLGGIPNIIKDSRLPRSVVEACYPGVDRFREQLFAFDPKRIFRSELSERLGL